MGSWRCSTGCPAATGCISGLSDRTILDVSLLEDEDVVERVFVSAPEEGSDYPAEATYRNLRDYRELKLQLEFNEQVGFVSAGHLAPEWGIACCRDADATS